MDVRPLNYFEQAPDEMCKFELFGLTNASMVPVMITMTPAAAAAIGIQKQPQPQAVPLGSVPGATTITAAGLSIPVASQIPIQTTHATAAGSIPIVPANYSREHLQQLNTSSGSGGDDIGGGVIFQKSDYDHHYYPYHQYQHHPLLATQHYPPPQQHQANLLQTKPLHCGETTTIPTPTPQMISSSTSCIPKPFNGTEDPVGGESGCNTYEGGSLMSGGCGAGCTALIIGIGIGGGGGSSSASGGGNNVGGSSGSARLTAEDESKKPPCKCTYMSFENFADYQTTGFGGLPDVTEHSNIRRSITRQDSLANSESTDAASLQKSKKQIKPAPSKRKYCVFSFSVIVTLMLIAIVAILLYQFLLRTPNRNSHDQRLKIVRKILKDIPLIDGHNNLAWNIRKYSHNSLDILDRTHKDVEEASIWQRPWWSQTDIPRLKEGLVGAQVWSVYVPCEAQGLDAVQIALEQIDIIHRFAEQYPKELTLAASSQEILAAHQKGQLASLIGIEGGHALGSSLGVLRSLHSLGARYVTLTNQCDTSWAGSSSMSMDKGLSAFGKAIIKEMNRLGMMIDLSHSSDATVRDVLELTRAPVIFSNSVARSICNSSRNIPDQILRAVADNGGLIMISFDSQHVSCDETSTLHDVIAHIKYIRSIAGIQHIGIGARYDGMQSPPVGLEDVSKYPNLLATLLEDSNWSEEDISMLAGRNFLRVLSSVENVRDYWKRAAIPPLEVTEPLKKSQCTYMSS
ncbi:unnamed protein product [Hermetia illucens]|uniref:Dipeptidase n=1 Tax=Hermetia illucens TaxID=343691 RepID=A0A7R8UID0_HERIL|nr:unnamed protein product [Hermetia illucens]